MSEILDNNLIKNIINSYKETEEFKRIASFFTLPDKEFEVLSNGALLELEKQLNDSNTKIILSQIIPNTFNSEDIKKILPLLMEQLTTNDISQIKIDFIEKAALLIINAINQNKGTATKILQIPIELCRENAKVPTYAHDGDGAMDIYSPEEYTIKPGKTIIIQTGIKVALPFGYALLVQPRSGLSVKTKFRVANTPGLIDSQYRGEIGVVIENIANPIEDIEYDFDSNGTPLIKSILHGKSYTIEKGERIAQLRLVEVPTVSFYQVNKIDENTERSNGGFGSTGTK